MTNRRRPWDRYEVEATVADYLEMLRLEVRGEQYNKSDHRRHLKSLLADRSDAAVERKHQNISAILIEMGLPAIDGYKPLGNYQSMLAEIVLDQASRSHELLAMLEERVTATPVAPDVDQILECWIEPFGSFPVRRVRERPPPPRIQKIDFLQREIQNSALGRAGEEFVVRFEQARLLRAGQDNLAADVEHVVETRGDHLGFDVLSFDPDGRERLIEVKTTSFGAYTPFFVTRNELTVSQQDREQYHVYRVFRFSTAPKLFGLAGAIDHTCELESELYSARVSGWV